MTAGPPFAALYLGEGLYVHGELSHASPNAFYEPGGHFLRLGWLQLTILDADHQPATLSICKADTRPGHGIPIRLRPVDQPDRLPFDAEVLETRPEPLVGTHVEA